MFGLSAPDNAACAWGARAIYKPYEIDLLHDRQSWSGEEAKIKKLQTWLNKVALPKLRKEVKREYLETNESREIVISDGKFQLIANPRSSYGYLYIGAWEVPE